MEVIDQATFNFSPKIGLAVAVMVGFLVFAVALDLTWDQFRRVLKKPKVPGIGLFAQYIILPGVAFGIGLLMAGTPSIALGLLLVACCPAGALSNYLTGVARGSVATSVSMTAISTLFSVVVTPLLFAFWASMNPETQAVLAQIKIDPKRVAVAFFPELAGVAITSILWGVVHLTIGFAIAAVWMRMPIADDPGSATARVSLPSQDRSWREAPLTDPKHAATARISQHGREGSSYPLGERK